VGYVEVPRGVEYLGVWGTWRCRGVGYVEVPGGVGYLEV